MFAGIDTAALIRPKGSPFRLILFGLVVSAQIMFMYAKKSKNKYLKDSEASSNSYNSLYTPRATSYNLRVLRGEVPIFTPRMAKDDRTKTLHGEGSYPTTCTTAAQTELYGKASSEICTATLDRVRCSIDELKDTPTTSFHENVLPTTEKETGHHIIHVRTADRDNQFISTFPRESYSTRKENVKYPQDENASPKAWSVAVQTESEIQAVIHHKYEKKEVISSQSEEEEESPTKDEGNTPIAIILGVITAMIAASAVFLLKNQAGFYFMKLARRSFLLVLPIYWVEYTEEIFVWLIRKIFRINKNN